MRGGNRPVLWGARQMKAVVSSNPFRPCGTAGARLPELGRLQGPKTGETNQC